VASGGHTDAPGIRIPDRMRTKRCGVTSTETMTKKLHLWRMLQETGDMKQVFVCQQFPGGLIDVPFASAAAEAVKPPSRKWPLNSPGANPMYRQFVPVPDPSLRIQPLTTRPCDQPRINVGHVRMPGECRQMLVIDRAMKDVSVLIVTAVQGKPGSR
jgi:hypothetical protein